MALSTSGKKEAAEAAAASNSDSESSTDERRGISTCRAAVKGRRAKAETWGDLG